MESFPSPEQSKPYAERKLVELLNHATDNLQPGPGYALSLEGIKVPPATLKYLEARLGLSLDANGASLSFSYGNGVDALHLDEMSHGIDGVDGLIRLKRINTYGYAPLIEKRANHLQNTFNICQKPRL